MTWDGGANDISGAPSTRRRVPLALPLLTTLGLAVSAGVFSLVGSLTGVAATSLTLGVLLRTLLVALVVVLAIHMLRVRGGRELPRWMPWVVAAVAYPLVPTTWGGDTMLAGGLGLDGPAAIGVDLAVWMCCAALGRVPSSPDPRVSGDPAVDSLLRR